MRKISFLLIIFLTTFCLTKAQTTTEWFPAGLNIKPFTANLLEARDGSYYLLGQKKLRLDIGTSEDIYRIDNGNSTLTFGSDLFTFTRLRSEKNFRFPVETIDYFFGVNSGYKVRENNYTEYGFRFRLSHISAHLVDGQYDENDSLWRNNRQPIVFSKEFVELFPFYKIDDVRFYLGFTYIFHIVPTDISKEIYQAGFDYYLTSLGGNITPFFADDFKLNGIANTEFGNNTLSMGVKFGKYDEKGFSIVLSYYSGKSVHGEYYDLSENYAAIGFNFDL
jgi:Protein of unknown function (DUF1207)